MLPNTSDLLSPLTDAGLTVRVVDGNRLAVVPAERITDNLRQHIRLHKSELLALLAANDPHRQSVALEFHFCDGGGGVLIDHEDYESAVLDITERWGARIDLPDLITRLQSMDEAAKAEATRLIAQIKREGNP